MKKVILNIFITIYVVIAIFTTVCLLSYNEYKVSEFGNNSIILITNDELSPDFNKGDLVIVSSANKSKIAIGDKIFFYKQNTLDRTIDVTLATVEGREAVTSTEITFTVEGDYQVSSTYVIGSSKNTTVIPKVGTVLSILESKWGFLFLIVLPSLIAFIYEITVVFGEIREAKKESK
ncbi:MAG: hypothetical protein ACI4VQ_05635 [Clostridia bacterium]